MEKRQIDKIKGILEKWAELDIGCHCLVCQKRRNTIDQTLSAIQAIFKVQERNGNEHRR